MRLENAAFDNVWDAFENEVRLQVVAARERMCAARLRANVDPSAPVNAPARAQDAVDAAVERQRQMALLRIEARGHAKALPLLRARLADDGGFAKREREAVAALEEAQEERRAVEALVADTVGEAVHLVDVARAVVAAGEGVMP